MLQDYQTALVTGASSGIGAATVTKLCERGLEVHAVARRSERLAALAEKTGCNVHTLDVRDTDAVYATLSDIHIDVLVNNAGLGRGFDTLAQASREDRMAIADDVISNNDDLASTRQQVAALHETYLSQ